MPGSPAQLAALGLVAPQPGDRRVLQVGGRPLWAQAVGPGDQLHLRFAELCDRPTSAADLLALADAHRTVVVAGVPRPAVAGGDTGRRFADLVAVCWDRDVRLVVLSEHSREEVLDAEVTDRERMASRLGLLRDA